MQSQTRTLVILGTGGTIAGTAADAHDNVGYRAAQLGVAQLLAGVPVPAGTVVEAEQVAQLDSKDMDFATWQRLAQRVHTRVAPTTPVEASTVNPDGREESLRLGSGAGRCLGAVEHALDGRRAAALAAVEGDGLPARLEAALRDGLQVKLGLADTRIHEVEMVGRLGSAARPVWICITRKVLPHEPAPGRRLGPARAR